MSDNLIEIKNLKKYFNVGNKKVLKAVDGVNLTIKRGSTYGLVGESGCGKSTFGKVILGLYQPTKGEVIFDGINIFEADKETKFKLKRKMQIIFQDPYSSLNPRMTAGDIIAEGIEIHQLYHGQAKINRLHELLDLVGLNKEHASRFPHEFSGGQRQRIGIARALAIEPDFIVCDEPISALDVSIQAQVVNLLIELQQKLNLTYLFIAHDLTMVKHISDQIGVMYLGKLIEQTNSVKLYENPAHPYTQSLLSAIPIADPKIEESKKRIMLEGEVPSPINIEPGCRFKKRCRYVMDICNKKEPELIKINNHHYCACFLNK